MQTSGLGAMRALVWGEVPSLTGVRSIRKTWGLQVSVERGQLVTSQAPLQNYISTASRGLFCLHAFKSLTFCYKQRSKYLIQVPWVCVGKGIRGITEHEAPLTLKLITTHGHHLNLRFNMCAVIETEYR
jgi:hypothetical protein